MLIEAGFDIAFECPAQTPMLLQLNVHPSRDADLVTPDRIASDPPLAMRAYLDLFGNRVTRVGAFGFGDDSGTAAEFRPDESRPDAALSRHGLRRRDCPFTNPEVAIIVANELNRHDRGMWSPRCARPSAAPFNRTETTTGKD